MDERTEEGMGILMKGIKYRVTYVDGIMDFVHGNYYETDVIYIPELEVTINYLIISKGKEDYTKAINDVIPKKLGEIDIDENDIKKIKSVVDVVKTKKELIKKYIGDKK